MSARAIPVGDLSGTIDPVTGVIVLSLKLRHQVPSHQGLYQAIATDLQAGDPTATYAKTIGLTAGVVNGDADVVITIPTI